MKQNLNNNNNNESTLVTTVKFSAASFLQKEKYQKQWIKFCQKNSIKDTTLKISDWVYHAAYGVGFYNEKLGIKLRPSIPRMLLAFLPIIGWIILGILVSVKGAYSFVKMKTGNLVKVEE